MVYSLFIETLYYKRKGVDKMMKKKNIKKQNSKTQEIVHYRNGGGAGSDITLKKEVKNITEGLSLIAYLKPVLIKHE